MARSGSGYMLTGQLYIVGGCTAGGPVNEDILYQRDSADFFFQLFGGNLLAVFKNYEVFLAAGNIKEAFPAQMAQVAGTEPFAFHNLGGKLRSLVVAVHNGFSADPDFLIHDFHLAAGQHVAYGVHIVRIVAVYCHQGGAFGDSVALEDENFPAGGILLRFPGSGGASAYDDVQGANAFFTDLVQDFTALMDARTLRRILWF